MGLCFSVLCCCGSCLRAGGSCCCAMGKGAAAGSRQASKATYVLLLLVSGLVAWLAQRYGPDGGGTFFELDFVCDGSDGNSVCSANGIVYRISLMNVVFMALMLLLTTNVPTFTGDRSWAPIAGDGFHQGWWSIKLVLYLACMCAVPFLPSDPFDEDDNAYAWVARVASGLFLILQTVLLIDFAYQLNEDWLARAFDGESQQNGWVVGLVVISLGLLGFGFAGTAILFTQYSDCGIGQTFNIINLVAFVGYALLTGLREKLTDQPGSAVPMSVVFFFTTYLVWASAESVADDPDCRPLDNGSDAIVFVGVLVAMLSLVWLAYTATKRATNLIAGDSGSGGAAGGDTSLGGIYAVGTDDKGREVLARDRDRDGDGDAEVSDNKNDAVEDKPHIFYLIMILASLYMSMLLTNWGVNDVSNGPANIGEVSSWVKIVSAWLTILLYTWTLIAPRVLEGREFDY